MFLSILLISATPWGILWVFATMYSRSHAILLVLACSGSWTLCCTFDWLMLHIGTYTATHCHTLQHTATHCNTLQHTAVCKRFHDEMWRSHLVVKSLTHGSWSGNHSTKKPPRGGGFPAINRHDACCTQKQARQTRIDAMTLLIDCALHSHVNYACCTLHTSFSLFLSALLFRSLALSCTLFLALSLASPRCIHVPTAWGGGGGGGGGRGRGEGEEETTCGILECGILEWGATLSDRAAVRACVVIYENYIMCVFACVCVCVCVFVCVRESVCVSCVCLCLCVCRRVGCAVCAWYVCVYVCERETPRSRFLSLCTYVHLCTYTHTRVCMCVNVCTYVRMGVKPDKIKT